MELLQQVKTGFKRTVNWNEYKDKPNIFLRKTDFCNQFLMQI